MESLAQLFEHNIIVVYFFYGLAFFSMGVVIVLEYGRASDFPIAQAMLPLAAFGIIHGLHEWFEMFQLLEQAGATNIPEWLLQEEVRIAHLVISFALLVIFGVRLVFANHRPQVNDRLAAFASAGILVAVWLLSLFVSTWVYNPSAAEIITLADVLSRYILAIPGALLASWAIFLEQRTFERRGMPGFGRLLLGAAVALFLYGTVGQLFTRPSFIFPANVLNSELFLAVTGLPVQLFRTVVAVIMAVLVIQALRAFELERQARLRAANLAREEAQQQAWMTQERARQQTQQLNRELQNAIQNLSTVYNFSRSSAATLDRDELVNEILPRFIQREPRFAASRVYLREQVSAPLQLISNTVCRADPQAQALMSQKAEEVGHYVADTGQAAWWTGERIEPVHVPEDMKPEMVVDDPLHTGGRTIGVPLVVQGQVVGSLVVCTFPYLSPFTEQDFSLVSTIGGQLNMALQNATLYSEVRERDVLRGELLHRVVSAQEHERQRIARELHDGTGQVLTALGLGLAGASQRVQSDPELVAHQLQELKNLSGQALEELHNVIADLRPSVLDNLGLVAALRGQVQAFEARTGIKATLTVTGQRRRMEPDLETIVFRIGQEALTNVARHARAETAEVNLTIDEDKVLLRVTDDGQGFEPQVALHATDGRQRAWGLLGMQERVSLVGGTCDIISSPGAGTVIEAEIPVVRTVETEEEKLHVPTNQASAS